MLDAVFRLFICKYTKFILKNKIAYFLIRLNLYKYRAKLAGFKIMPIWPIMPSCPATFSPSYPSRYLYPYLYIYISIWKYLYINRCIFQKTLLTPKLFS